MSVAMLESTNSQWNDLKDIDEVDPINESDMICLAELREVLKRHGRADRLGVALLHKHFDLAEGEMLVEYTDKESRVLTIQPMRPEAAGKTVGTIFRLQDGDGLNVVLGCMQYCGANVQGNHGSFHRKT